MQLVGERRRGRLTEQRQRLAFRRHDGDLDVGLSHRARLAGRHQRELVGGEQPNRSRRDDDRDPLRVTPVDVPQEPTVRVRVTARPPGGRPFHADDRAPAGRHDQRVERQGSSVAQVDLSRGVVDADHGVDDQLGLGFGGEPRQRDTVGVTECEWLRHGQRPVGELGIGRDQREADLVACPGPQRQKRLEPGNAAAGDDGVHGSTHFARVACAAATRAIGTR